MANSLLCKTTGKFNLGDIEMTQKISNRTNGIKVCFTAYRPTVTENDVDDLVQFIVMVVQEGFKTIKAV